MLQFFISKSTQYPTNKKPRYMAGMVNFKFIYQGCFTPSIKTYSL